MLRISSAASGEEVSTLVASDLPQEGVPTIAWLKSFLARKHFQNEYSRFQLRILGNAIELKEDDSITPPLELQLVLIKNLLPADEERDIAFVKSCQQRDMEEVERNLQALQNPNVDLEGWHESPLSLAVYRGHAHMVRLLLEARANVDAADFEGHLPLHLAAISGNLEVVRLLLDSGAKMEAGSEDVRSPLHLAAMNGTLQIARFLLDSGANKEATDLLGRRPLHCAAEADDNWEVCRLLLDSRAEIQAVDDKGHQPLHLAARQGHLESVRLLLDHRADLEATTSDGLRPLHCAAVGAHVGVVRLLLDSGADTNTTDSRGQTPSKVSALCRSRQHLAVEELIDERKRRRLESPL